LDGGIGRKVHRVMGESMRVRDGGQARGRKRRKRHKTIDDEWGSPQNSNGADAAARDFGILGEWEENKS
jgi:hypothetical protein